MPNFANEGRLWEVLHDDSARIKHLKIYPAKKQEKEMLVSHFRQ